MEISSDLGDERLDFIKYNTHMKKWTEPNYSSLCEGWEESNNTAETGSDTEPDSGSVKTPAYSRCSTAL